MYNIDIYDMLVFEDKSGSIYQDCVCSISKEVPNEDKNYTFISCSLFGIEQYETDDFVCRRNGLDNPWYYDTKLKLKEIWTRTDEDTYKKVYELVDGKLTKISYSQGMKVYHRRQEVTYDQIKKFMVKDEESVGE